MQLITDYLVKSGLSVFQVRSKSQSGVRQKGCEEVLAMATGYLPDWNSALLQLGRLEPVQPTTKLIVGPIGTWRNAPPALL